MDYVLYYLILINVITFILRGIDKRKAARDDFRIPERILLLCVGSGGGLGGIFGMNYFRHKRAKGEFLWKFWIMVLFWIVLVFVYTMYYG